MLEKNIIPHKEPLLRVGIVLPEDGMDQIVIRIPKDTCYSLNDAEGTSRILSDEKLLFTKSDDKVVLASGELSKTWTINPVHPVQIGPEKGLIVKGIVAGRGFHWHKYIDVFLPGSIEITRIKRSLILTNELPLEQYLMCVATSEMGAKCPSALIEAQTIVARSWMLANVEQKHVDLGMDVCNDDCCQRYQGTGNLSTQSINGAQKTAGQVLMYKNQICDTRYSKSCGGVMETFATIWGGNDKPYLQSIPDAAQDFSHNALPLSSEVAVKSWIDATPHSFCSAITVPEASLKQYLGNVDEQGKYFRWEVRQNQSDLVGLLNQRLNLNAKSIIDLIALQRGGSGRIIKLKIIYSDQEDQTKEWIVDRDFEIRRVLHQGFLYSSCIYFEKIFAESIDIPDKFIIHGAGWGHGVGLCQIGALGMSLQGYDVDQILKHYYPSSRLHKIY